MNQRDLSLLSHTEIGVYRNCILEKWIVPEDKSLQVSPQWTASANIDKISIYKHSA